MTLSWKHVLLELKYDKKIKDKSFLLCFALHSVFVVMSHMRLE